MLFPTLIAGGFSLILAGAPDAAAEQVAMAQQSRAVVAEASAPTQTQTQTKALTNPLPSDLFPTEAMAEQFEAYLAWTKAQGLSRLAVFERLSDDQIQYSPNLSAERPLPTPEMAEQFAAYLRWTREQNLSRFYAFQAANFD